MGGAVSLVRGSAASKHGVQWSIMTASDHAARSIRSTEYGVRPRPRRAALTRSRTEAPIADEAPTDEKLTDYETASVNNSQQKNPMPGALRMMPRMNMVVVSVTEGEVTPSTTPRRS
jgi:hypothetical protein